jgi:hypothetical protein
MTERPDREPRRNDNDQGHRGGGAPAPETVLGRGVVLALGVGIAVLAGVVVLYVEAGLARPPDAPSPAPGAPGAPTSVVPPAQAVRLNEGWTFRCSAPFCTAEGTVTNLTVRRVAGLRVRATALAASGETVATDTASVSGEDTPLAPGETRAWKVVVLVGGERRAGLAPPRARVELYDGRYA